MSRQPGWWAALASAAVAFGPGAAWPDPPLKSAEPDEELLEFLGTVDSATDANTQPDDESWIEYLSQTDIDGAAQGGAAQGRAAQGGAAPGNEANNANAPGQPGAQGSDEQRSDAKAGAPKVKPDGQ